MPLIRDRKGTLENLCNKDFARLSGELSGAILLKTLVLLAVPFLVDISAPKKKYLAPPLKIPQFAADTLPAARPLPAFPPPSWDFQ